MTDFKKGDTLKHRKSGKEYVVDMVYPGSGQLVFKGWEETGTYDPTFFELVSRAPVDRSKIRAGDVVTVNGTATGGARYDITGTVWEPSHSPGELWVGPVALGSVLLTVTDHVPAPRPDLVGALYDYMEQRGDEELLDGLAVVEQERVNREHVAQEIENAISRYGEGADGMHAAADAALAWLGLGPEEST